MATPFIERLISFEAICTLLLTHHADAPNVANAGYRVVTKEVVPQLDGSKKANLEVEIAVDLMKLAPFYDTAVLVSGNGKLLKG